MAFIFKRLLKEPLWLSVALICIFISVFLVIAQARAIAQVLKIGIDLNRIEQVSPSPAKVGKVGNRWEVIKEVVRLYNEQGKEKAFEYLLSFRDFFLIAMISLIALAISILSQLFTYLKVISIDFLSIKVTSTIRENLFEKIVHAPAIFLKGQQSGDLLSRSLNDVLLLKAELNHAFESILYGTLLTALGVSVLFIINLQFTLILMVTGIFLIASITVISFFLKIFVKKSRKT